MSNKNNKPLVTVTVTNCTTRKLMLFLLFSVAALEDGFSVCYITIFIGEITISEDLRF